MKTKTKRPVKFPGFFECQQHDQLAILIEGKPKTLCRNCFKKINGNLALYLGQTMAETLRLEYLVIQQTDMITDILGRLAEVDQWIERLAGGKTNEKKGPS